MRNILERLRMLLSAAMLFLKVSRPTGKIFLTQQPVQKNVIWTWLMRVEWGIGEMVEIIPFCGQIDFFSELDAMRNARRMAKRLGIELEE